jgi:hypothetical protein
MRGSTFQSRYRSASHEADYRLSFDAPRRENP